MQDDPDYIIQKRKPLIVEGNNGLKTTFDRNRNWWSNKEVSKDQKLQATTKRYMPLLTKWNDSSISHQYYYITIF